MGIPDWQARTIKMLRERHDMSIKQISNNMNMTPEQVSDILQSEEYEEADVTTDTPANDIVFMRQFASVMSKIANLLEMRFTPQSEEGMEEFLYQISKGVLQLHRNQNTLARDYELARLAMFAKHLTEVHENNTKLFNQYKQELNEIGYDRYFGVRFELDTAASLIRKDVAYEHPDPPDFVIQREQGEIAIECTTSHFSGGERTAREKYTQFLTSKSSKDYFNEGTALFVDVTNIDYSEAHTDEPNKISSEEEKKWVRECSDNFNLDIGSVILFRYVGHGTGVGHHYRRCDIQENISQELREFLDDYYPISEVSTQTSPYHFSVG